MIFLIFLISRVTRGDILKGVRERNIKCCDIEPKLALHLAFLAMNVDRFGAFVCTEEESPAEQKQMGICCWGIKCCRNAPRLTSTAARGKLRPHAQRRPQFGVGLALVGVNSSAGARGKPCGCAFENGVNGKVSP